MPTSVAKRRASQRVIEIVVLYIFFIAVTGLTYGASPRNDVFDVGPVDLRGGEPIEVRWSDFSNGDVRWLSGGFTRDYSPRGGPNDKGYITFTQNTSSSTGAAISPEVPLKPNRDYIVSLVVRRRFDGGEFLVGLRQLDATGTPVYSRRNGIPAHPDQEWIRFEIPVHAHPQATQGHFYFTSYTPGGMLDVAEIQLIELPAAELVPFGRGEGVTFEGSLGNLPMEVAASVVESDRIVLTTTGSTLELDLVQNEMKFSQTIERSRLMATATPSVPLSGLEVLHADDEKIVLANDSLTMSLHADGLLLMAPHVDMSMDVKGLFTGEWNQFEAGHLLSIDDFGGISVNPAIPLGTGRLARAELIEGEANFPYPRLTRYQLQRLNTTREWFPNPTDQDRPQSGWVGRWHISPGERLGISVFPPRPFDWEKAFVDNVYQLPQRTDPSQMSAVEATPVIERHIKDDRVSVFGIWNRIFSFREGGGHGGSDGPMRLRSKEIEENLFDYVDMIHEKGARAIVYLSPWWYYDHDHHAYFQELKQFAERFQFDGVYWDGSYALDWLKTYELLRMTRDLFPYGEGFIYHHTTGQPNNAGYPLARPDIFIPVLDTYSDRVYRGEHVVLTEHDSTYPRYVAAGYRVSNAIGVIKADDWNLPFDSVVLEMLKYSGRTNTIAWTSESGFTPTQYLSVLDSLYELWKEHGDSDMFYEEHYLPALRNLAPEMLTPFFTRGPWIDVAGWSGRYEFEEVAGEIRIYLNADEDHPLPETIFVNIPEAAAVLGADDSEAYSFNQTAGNLAITLGDRQGSTLPLLLRIKDAHDPTSIRSISTAVSDTGEPLSGAIPLNLQVETSTPEPIISRVILSVDDRVLFDRDGLSDDLVLDTSLLTDGQHVLRLRVEGAHGTPHAEMVVRFSVSNMTIVSPSPNRTVFDDLVIQLDSQLEPQSIQSVEIRVDEDVIYSGNKVPEKLTFDSTRLEDGFHRLDVTVNKIGDGLPEQKSVGFLTSNWRMFYDPLRDPQIDPWVKAALNQRTSDRSEGWAYVTDSVGDFHGDGDRMAATQPGEYLEWEQRNLSDFLIVLYGKDVSNIDSLVQVYTSTDKTNWMLTPYTTELRDDPSSAWSQMTLRGKTDDPENLPRWIRLVVVDPEAELQLGEVLFRSPRWR